MNTFAVNVIVTPYASRSEDLTPYPARGVFKIKIEIITTGAGQHSTLQPTLGIRLSEFVIPIKQRDQIEILAGQHIDDDIGSRFFTVADTNPDGQGGSELILKDSQGPR
jgi:hypothetical protein